MTDEVGITIKKFRLRHGLSQNRLAELLDVSQRTVSRWERGDDRPSLATQSRLRDIGIEPPVSIISCLLASVEHCPTARALSRKDRLRLLSLSPSAIEKRPSMVNFLDRDLIKMASGVLLVMLEDRDLQSDILNREVACVVATTRSVLRTDESSRIGLHKTTISYFVHDGIIYSDAISVPCPIDEPCGYTPHPVPQVRQI